MASDPLWMNDDGAGSPAYTAQELRSAFALPLTLDANNDFAAREGVNPSFSVGSIVGTDVVVNKLNAVIDVGFGPYWVAHEGSTLPIAAADSVNPRIDLVVLRVYDDDHDGSGFRYAQTEYVNGTADIAPNPPTAPAGSIPLIEVTVPESGGGSPSEEVVALWTVASGGVLPVRDATELPTTGRWEGMTAYQQDTDELLVWNGTAWFKHYLPIEGGTLTGDLVLAGPPTADLHPVNRLYANQTYLSLSGGTMTGAIVLPGDPTADLQATSKQYVDNAGHVEFATQWTGANLTLSTSYANASVGISFVKPTAWNTYSLLVVATGVATNFSSNDVFSQLIQQVTPSTSNGPIFDDNGGENRNARAHWHLTGQTGNWGGVFRAKNSTASRGVVTSIWYEITATRTS